jgi:ubiquinone/menaquinone biosynthesis C-methylase UbiE
MKIQISTGMWKFAEKVLKCWGLKPWGGYTDKEDVLFFGMYGDNDYELLRSMDNDKSIFWCGSDITQMLHNSDRKRIIKMYPEMKHYTETKEEAEELKQVSDNVEYAPSFLEPVESFFPCFKPSKTPNIYLSGHPNREEEYGFDLCREIAREHPEFIFHFYGVDGINEHNVIYHGFVENEQFNKEIKEFQCGLRCNAHDGFSEIVIKSALLGQYPISFLPYEKVPQFRNKEELVFLLSKVREQTESNMEARNYWIARLNSYPWMVERGEDFWKNNKVASGQYLPYKKKLVEKIKSFNPVSILDIGCGAGHDLELLRKEFPNAKLAGLDISESAVIETLKKVPDAQVIMGKADDLPFENNSFDVVITDAVLIDVPPEKIEKVRDEIMRVAKKGVVLAEFHHNDFGALGKASLKHWARNYVELFGKGEIEKITDQGSWKWEILAYFIKIIKQ